MIFNPVGKSASFTTSTLPAYLGVFEYVEQEMSRGRQYDYCAATGYDISNLRSNDYAAIVAYHLSVQVAAHYRDYATGVTTERQMRAAIRRLVPGWEPTLDVLAESLEG